MPEQKGRRSKRDRERERRRVRAEGPARLGSSPEGAEPEARDAIPASGEARATHAARVQAAQQAAVQQPAPPAATRATGVMLAFVTAIGAAWLIYDAVSGDKAGAELIGRLAAGVSLALLVIVVGVLSVAPDVARKILRRFLTAHYRAEEGDTVESVARSFGMTARDVLGVNPELADGLAAGQTVYIPRRRR